MDSDFRIKHAILRNFHKFITIDGIIRLIEKQLDNIENSREFYMTRRLKITLDVSLEIMILYEKQLDELYKGCGYDGFGINRCKSNATCTYCYIKLPKQKNDT